MGTLWDRSSFLEIAAARNARSILCDGKLDWDNPLDVAEYLAEELRANLPQGLWSLKREIELRWNVKGFVPKMLKALGKYLEDQQTVLDTVDYKIADIVEQHPEFTIKEITSELSKEFPERKWGALTRRIQRLVKDCGIPISDQFKKLLSLIRS